MSGVRGFNQTRWFMVNIADGNAQNYEDLIAHVIQTVERSGIRLEREVGLLERL